jgi:hypothetical protein
MSQLALSPKDKIAVKALIASLNTRYGSKSPVIAVNWAKGTFTAVGASAPRQFFVTPAARPGTYRVKVAGQTGVTKAPVVKAVKAPVAAKPAPAVKAPAKACKGKVCCANKK